MDRMTEATARGLLDEIAGLERKLSVAEDQAKRTRAHTRWLWVVIAALIVGSAFLASAVQTSHRAADEAAEAATSAQYAQIVSCESGNLRLAGQRKIWSFFFEVTAASAKARHEPPAVLHFYDAYLAWITDEVLPDRDCTKLSQPIPEPGPPPSFERALKQSLRHQHAAQSGD